MSAGPSDSRTPRKGIVTPDGPFQRRVAGAVVGVDHDHCRSAGRLAELGAEHPRTDAGSVTTIFPATPPLAE